MVSDTGFPVRLVGEGRVVFETRSLWRSVNGLERPDNGQHLAHRPLRACCVFDFGWATEQKGSVLTVTLLISPRFKTRDWFPALLKVQFPCVNLLRAGVKKMSHWNLPTATTV